jgi:hypothetical protein
VFTHNRYKDEPNLGAYLGHYLADIQSADTFPPIARPGRRDTRLEKRFQVSAEASLFSPTFTGAVPIPVKILDVSTNGLGIKAPEMIPCGTSVQVVLEHAFVLGEVRYCIRQGDVFHTGVLVRNVLRSAKR